MCPSYTRNKNLTVAMRWVSGWCIMSNSKHSVARRGEWPTQEMQCDVRPASPLYLCTLHTPASMKDTRSRLNSEPAQDNSEESAKQKQTRDDQFLLRFISDHHTNNGWVEENSNAAYLSWKMLRVGFSCFISILGNFYAHVWKWMSRRILMSSIKLLRTGYHN